MKTIFLHLFSCFFIGTVYSQPFIDEVRLYQQYDIVNLPKKQSILFVGSSSFRLWKDYQSYFPGFNIINRGIGGSSLPDIIRYSKEMITSYQPKQIVIYCGENDFASSDTITSIHVTSKFIDLFSIIRNDLPQAHISFISIKPSPSRWKHKDKIIAANASIKLFLNNQTNTSFINVWDSMLDIYGKPLSNIYKSDSLHMNVNGYIIWKNIITPYLIKQ
jgi:lysophospholipase L1-like esterase